jgi:PAS domain S-box-containing protein
MNILGYKNIAEVPANPLHDHYTSKELERAQVREEKILRGKPIQTDIEVEINRQDGSIGHLQVFLTETIWAGKRQRQIVYNDITESKRVQNALQASEHNFRNSLDVSPMGIRIVDGERNTLFANKEFLKIFSYKNISEIGIYPLQDRYTPEENARFLLRKEKRSRGEVIPENIKVELLAKDGSIRYLEVYGSEILWDGKLERELIYKDVTESTQAEKALQESEEKYRMIVDNSRDMIFTINDKEEFVYVSPSVKDMLGYNETDLIGKSFISLVHPEDVPIIEEETQRSLLPGYKVSSDNEYRMRHASGEWHWVVSRGTRVVDKNGKFLHFIGIARDITEHKQAEAEKLRIEEKAQISSRLAAIGEMAAGIAHEINNPLTSVLGFSQIVLEKENVPEDVKENLKLISDGSQRVAEIVRRLLMFARQAKPFKTSVNINEILQNTLKLREYVLKTNNIEVITMFDPELPWISVDPSQMQQVFLNLIVNAEQAMKKAHGRGILTITSEKKLNNIRLSVQDDGPGISKENMRHLFEPFFTTKDPGEGTGLGLSLSRSIILEHNGEMSVESEIGNGATFVIELPIIEAAPPEIETTSPPTQAQLSTKRNGRILVIDDEPTIRELLEKALTRVGHSVDVIADATAAMEIIDAGTIYDVIITDVRMPGMNGLELYALAVRKMPAMKHRIIFITGDVMGADIKAFIGNNNILCLTKPFRMNELERKIDNILDAESKQR